MKRAKLFCLPYAGASAAVYGKWRRRLMPYADLHLLELAGRGARMGEPLPPSLEAAVEDLFQLLLPHLDGTPYALFGHSMGSLLAFELVYRIRSASLPEPDTLFVSGRSAPHVPLDRRHVHLLSEAEFREELLAIGGTSPEFFDTPSLYQLFEPIIRSDYRMIETYTYREKTRGIGSTLIVLSGTEDRTIRGGLEEWNRHAEGRCRIVHFGGGHFFIHSCEEEVLRLIASELSSGSLEGAGTT